MTMHRPLTAIALILSLSLASCGEKEAPPATPYAVEEVPLYQVAEDLKAGKTTSVAATQAYIDRIKMYDGPLNGVIAIAPDALQQAAAADQRRKDGKTHPAQGQSGRCRHADHGRFLGARTQYAQAGL